MVLSVRAQTKNIKRTIDSENHVVLRNAFTRERAVTRTAIIMVIAFEVCVLLGTTYPFIQLVFVESTDIKINKILFWLSTIGVTLSMFNSLINPFLYAWRLPKYRKAFKYILKLTKKKISPLAYLRSGSTTEAADRTAFQLTTPVHPHLVPRSAKIQEPLTTSVKDDHIDSTKL